MKVEFIVFSPFLYGARDLEQHYFCIFTWAAHIALCDLKTGILLTGDSLYPGRLYINDWTAYANSQKISVESSENPITAWQPVEDNNTPWGHHNQDSNDVENASD